MRQLDHYQGAGRKLGTGSLEQLRVQLTTKIEANRQLNRRQKHRIIQELDFLINHERLRRVQQATHQWRNVETDHQLQVLQRVHETVNRIRTERAETNLRMARSKYEALTLRLEIEERVWTLLQRVRKDSPRKAKPDDFRQLANEEELEQRREEHLYNRLMRRALNRAKFVQTAREQFPDLAEELIDHYDQLSYGEGERRQP